MPSNTPESLADLLPLTPDVRTEQLAELKRLLPDLFTNEGRLNPDEFRQLVEPNEFHETERYEYKWNGKAVPKREAFTLPRFASEVAFTTDIPARKSRPSHPPRIRREGM